MITVRSTLRGLSKASVFFLDILSQHPSDDLQNLARLVIPLLQSQPKLYDCRSEKEFAHALRRWKDRVKAVRLEMDGVNEVDRRDDSGADWWMGLSNVVGILEGRKDVILRVCDDNAADWKEVVAAWGMFVDPRMRRQDLP